METLLPVLAFAFGTLVVTAAAYFVLSSKSIAMDRRLREVTGASHGAQADGSSSAQVVAALKRVGERAPRSPRELSLLRQRLIQAGYRSGEALPVFFAIRFIGAVVGFAIFATPFIDAAESYSRGRGGGVRLSDTQHGACPYGTTTAASHPLVFGRRAGPARGQR